MAAGEAGDEVAFGIGEAEKVLGEIELGGGLAEDDLRGGIGEEPGGDLGGGGPVVGLSTEVAAAVADVDVRFAVLAAEFAADRKSVV